ncbi:MAG: AarF/UbiB family protein, partial [Anaplasma sp.]
KAVKVLRPGIEDEFLRDVRLMRFLVCLVGRLKSLSRFRLHELVETFASICRLELDLRFEAANAEELRENAKAEREILLIPEVDWHLTSRRVLTLQWVDAVPIYEIDKLKNRKTLARNLILCFCNQVYRDRFFHADMHPGNLMVNAQGQIVAVDFGIMGRLDEETRTYVSEILIGFLSRDYRRVAEAHHEAGYIPGRCEEFITACRAIWEPIANVHAQGFSAAELLAQLFKITAEFNMQVQPQLLLLQKTMILVEGICRQLAPDMNLWKIAEEWMQERGDRDGCMEQLRRSHAYKSLKKVQALMSKIDRSLDVIVERGAHEQRSKRIMRYSGSLLMLVVLLAILVVIRGT